ncbi:hypothetical protein DNH61_21945 [Paenibacillus sambharensis]|uniref:Flagellar hook-length control protein-like C-terminal domain-containing protein n=1 Tax=Paenibacillus sambharensis TaxID=1803190 RepID=A0A2W1L038_9BACL|nr:hypothetical protein [Paenibacillus sambharensis]PZD93308.1 hypothetical protein DNH61_21945 [Paenibacillus sambharensis]
MNIGQLMRGMLGEAQPADGKALELKVGQIVRGVIMQMMEGQEAMVQINGVAVRARLETALLPGQTTMLQVQPESAGGLVTLKAVDPSGSGMPEESLRDLVKTLGLQDRKWAMDIVRDLKREGFPVNRETAQSLQQAAAARPTGVNEEQWMQAAGTALKRGLPVTQGVLSGLHQAQSGKPVTDLLQTLRQQLSAMVENADSQPAAAGTSAGGRLPAAAAKVLSLLDAGAALMKGAASAEAGPAAGQAAHAGSVPAAAARGGSEAAGQQTLPQQAAASGSAAAHGQAASGKPAAAPDLVQAGNAPGMNAGREAGTRASGNAAGSASMRAVNGGGAESGSAKAAESMASGSSTSGSTTGTPSAVTSGSGQNWVGGLMKWLGVNHESMLAETLGGQGKAAAAVQQAADDSARGQQLPDQKTDPSAARQPAPPAELRQGQTPERSPFQMALQTSGPQSEPAAQADLVRTPAAETLKGALLSLVNGDDMPPAVRETAQQLVQHITGQQLLLSPERGGSLLSHVTLMIPFHGPDGSQTASVHVQSRRGKKGELDADNCRLLFDLQMKQLGATVVDVQVVEKMVSLSIWNDHPVMGAMVREARAEVSAALAGAGYQLSALNARPLPDPAEAAAQAADKKAPLLPEPSAYQTKRYKGVDYRA